MFQSVLGYDAYVLVSLPVSLVTNRTMPVLELRYCLALASGLLTCSRVQDHSIGGPTAVLYAKVMQYTTVQ